MSNRRFLRWSAPAFAIVVISAITIVGAPLTTAHDQSTPPPDPLLAEVRALRAELNQAASSSIRTQLLVARLQLQEQRINLVAGKLNEVRQLLTIKESAQLPIVEGIKHMEEELRAPTATAEQRTAIEEQLPERRARLAQFQREERQHRAQEIELAAQLATEQGRWLDFNARLDELERQLPIR
jgi:hypothetical protein